MPRRFNHGRAGFAPSCNRRCTGIDTPGTCGSHGRTGFVAPGTCGSHGRAGIDTRGAPGSHHGPVTARKIKAAPRADGTGKHFPEKKS